MPTPGEQKTVKSILEYAEALVTREEVEEKRAGFPTRREGDTLAGIPVPAIR